MFNEELMECGADFMMKQGLVMGRMIDTPAKSVMRDAVVTSAGEYNPFWYGDIDTVADYDRLKTVAQELKTNIEVQIVSESSAKGFLVTP